MTQTIPTRHLVVYADDDEDDQLLVRQAFADHSPNVDVVVLPNGRQAIDYLSRLSPLAPDPCLIILDINMPIMSGKEALVALRGLPRFAHTPVVLFSTSSLPHDRAFAERHGAGFITKPLDGRQMEHIAETFVSHCADDVRYHLQRRIGP